MHRFLFVVLAFMLCMLYVYIHHMNWFFYSTKHTSNTLDHVDVFHDIIYDMTETNNRLRYDISSLQHLNIQTNTMLFIASVAATILWTKTILCKKLIKYNETALYDENEQ